MSSTRIAKLAAIVSTNTAKIDHYLTSHGLPSPSFDVNHPADLGIPPEAIDIVHARRVAFEASMELQDLLQGPILLLRPVHYLLRSEGSTLQRSENSPPAYSALCYVVASRTLPHHVSWPRICAQDIAGLMFDEGHALANNTQDNLFDWLGKNPVQAKRFNSAISALISFSRKSAFLTQSFDWTLLGKEQTVMDVGDGQSTVSAILAGELPNLRSMVQDLSEVLLGAQKNILTQLISRIKFVEHDFYTNQPVEVDVYFLRAILHHLSDEYCIKILRCLVPALRNGARIVINDSLVPEPGTLFLLAERNIQAYEILIMTLFNGRECEKDEWIQLLRDADARFRFIDTKKPDVGTIGLILAKREDLSQTLNA
ncbi:hypothetical protein MMC29_002667 [Sticta canariensis]|nr:hypothetical protein [Sticta canariensis]